MSRLSCTLHGADYIPKSPFTCSVKLPSIRISTPLIRHVYMISCLSNIPIFPEGVEESRMLQPLLPDDKTTSEADDDEDREEENKQSEKVLLLLEKIVFNYMMILVD